jgi:glycerophosphoryl diester phosphodiesterase
LSRDDTHSEPAVIAHRCLGFDEPENSLKAVQLALRSPVTGIEIDVRLTKDLKWVVIHNPFHKSEERSVIRVHERTYGQLRREVIPLDTVLALFAAYPTEQLFIDVKDVGEEKQIIKMLHHYGIADRAVIIAWEPEILRRVHERDPAAKIGLSYVPIHSALKYIKGSINKPLSRHGVLLHFNEAHSFDVKHSVGNTSQHYLSDLPQLPLYSIQVPAMLCSGKLVREAHVRGIRVYPFQVTPLNYLLLRRAKVDGIITNHPMKFVK